MITTAEIIERLEFIGGHVMSGDRHHALQQIKELMQLLWEREQKELEEKAKNKNV